jgi:hypothetical protein
MEWNKSTTTTVVVSMGVLLTIGVMLVAVPSAYAESTCTGVCKNHHNDVDNSIDNSGQDNSVDNSIDNSGQDNSVDNSIDNSGQDNSVDSSVCTAPGGSVTGGGPGTGGGTGGAGGCNSI